MKIELAPGTVCVASGRVVEIDGPDSLTHVRARDMADGRVRSYAITDLQPMTKGASAADASFVPEIEWKRATALAKDLRPWMEQGLPEVEAKKLARRHGISVRQIRRARARYLRDPRSSSLVREKRGRKPGGSYIAPAVDRVIQHAIDKFYLRKERPTASYVVERAQSLCRRLALPEPSRKAVEMRIAARSAPDVSKARLGSHLAKQKWEPRPGQLKVNRPLELIQIDHTPVDVLVLTDDRKSVLGRPWLSVAIDVATRCIVGVYLSMDAPSSVSVSLCIEHACLPKKEGEGAWVMYGLPMRVLVDNGKDLRSFALQRGCEEHGIELDWRPVKKPHYGGHIERLIGTLMKIAHLVPGTTFSNVKERADYDSEKEARFTLDELHRWLVEKICRYYHVKRHRHLGVSPLVAWEEAHKDAAGQIHLPPLIARPLEFRMAFLPYVTRLVRRTGIELGNSRYWDDDLRPLLNQDAIVRYDPRSRGQVWVKRSDGVLVTANAIAGVAAQDLSALRRMDEATKARMNQELDKGLDTCDAIEAQARLETERARRRQQRAAAKQSAVADAPRLPSLPVPAMTNPARLAALTVEEWT